MNEDAGDSATPKARAPVGVTGGGGFRFENAVAARLLPDMLTGLFSLGVRFGRLQKLHWHFTAGGPL